MRTNQRPGTCHLSPCRTAVAAGQGVLTRRAGTWLVYCTPQHAADDAHQDAAAVVDPPADPPAEVRITGTPTQQRLITEALKLGLGLSVGETSGPHPQRDPADPRARLYVPVRVDARYQDAAAREMERER